MWLRKKCPSCFEVQAGRGKSLLLVFAMALTVRGKVVREPRNVLRFLFSTFECNFAR